MMTNGDPRDRLFIPTLKHITFDNDVFYIKTSSFQKFLKTLRCDIKDGVTLT